MRRNCGTKPSLIFFQKVFVFSTPTNGWSFATKDTPRSTELSRDQVRPGSTLREIAERRFSAGSSATAAEDYLAQCKAVRSFGDARPWNVTLTDGRTIQLRNYHFPDGSWVATHEDITDRLRGSFDHVALPPLKTFVDCLPDYVWIKDIGGRFLIANAALAKDHGRKNGHELLGLSDFDLHDKDLARVFRARELEIIRDGHPMIDNEETIVVASGVRKWLSSTKIPLRDSRNRVFALVGIARDITKRKRNAAMLEGQVQIFEMTASSASLDEIMLHLADLTESQLDGLFACVQIVAADGGRMRPMASPSLPLAFTEATCNIPIGRSSATSDATGQCEETVVVSDIAKDPLWDHCRDVASAHGVRSCWLTPIISSTRSALGTLALYSKTVREPTDAELAILGTAARIARAVIELKQNPTNTFAKRL